MSEPEPGPPPVAMPELGGRLSPAAVVLTPLRQLLPLALVVVAGDVPRAPALALAGAVLVGGVLRWARFRWRLEGGALVVEQGIVERRRRVVPLERIQSVELVRSLRHRLLGVVKLQVEVVGGGDEGTLDGLAPVVAERVRAALLAGRSERSNRSDRGAGLGAEGDGELLVRLRPGRLVVAGLTGGRVGVAAALLGTAEQLLGDRAREALDLLPGLGATGLAGLAGAVLVGAFALGVVAAAVTLWGFTLSRVGDELQVRRGLLEQRQETVRLARVQAVRIEQNFLRRPLGLASVRVEVAGQVRGDEAAQTGLVLPIGTLEEALDLAGRVLGRPSLAPIALVAAPPAARRRRLGWAAGAGLAATAAGVALLGPRGLGIGVVGGALAVLTALDAARGLAWAHVDGLVACRSGVVVRRLVMIPEHRVQTLLRSRGPGQRRLGLASLEPQIARSPSAWGGPRLIDLPESDARGLLVRLAAVSAVGRSVDDAGRDVAPHP